VELSEPGQIREGSNFSAELGGLKWGLKVVKAERPNKILWVARCLGLKAIHEWEFNRVEGKTIVTTRESMTGWMLLLTYPKARKALSNTDQKWLNDLKARAEST